MTTKPYRTSDEEFGPMIGLWLLFGFVAAFLGAQPGVTFFFDSVNTVLNRPGTAEDSGNWALAAFIWACIGAVVGATYSTLKYRHRVRQWEREEALKSERQRVSDERAYEAQKVAAQQQKQRQRDLLREQWQIKLATLPEAMASSYRTALDRLDKAVQHLKSAEAHRTASAFSPFWEAIERGLGRLDEHRTAVRELRQLVLQYDALCGGFPDLAGPPIPGELAALPDSDAGDLVAARFRSLAYEAQTNYHFSAIYEQRRTTAAVIAGFASLNEAVNHLGSMVQSSYAELSKAIAGSRRGAGSSNELMSVDTHISPLAASHSLGGQVLEMNRHLDRIVKQLN